MAQSAEWKKGYEDAIAQLKKMMQGQQGSGQSGSGTQGTDADGNPMQSPELNNKDQKEADKNAQKNAAGNSQASAEARQEAGEATGSCGGVISQETGAAIAKSEGYDGEATEEKSSGSLSNFWKDATIEACSKDNSPGMGSMVSHFKDYYMTSHDWKGDLKKYVGRALSGVEDDTKWGKKKWLAQDEIKKFDKESETSLSDVIFLIDCSGSVSDKLLQNIISECWTICKRKKISKVTYCYYDDGIRQMETNDTIKTDGIINPEMVSKIKHNLHPAGDIHGRGGNKEKRVMEQLVEMLKKSHKKPELVMWFTDGYTYSRPERPKMYIKNMLWVVYDNNNFETTDGSRVIHIKSEDIGK